ncbi:hypothetical protein [Shinella sp.]|uniref:hypothetical protein n=1 Tax=Shinella sp. TaxID=1870904 RepID=UPI003F6EBC03
MKEFAVMPLGAPLSSSVVMIVTPVAKVPNARRNSTESMVRLAGALSVSLTIAPPTLDCGEADTRADDLIFLQKEQQKRLLSSK